MFKVDYGKAIKHFREDVGMTRKEFYTKVGITQSRLSQLENNTFPNSEETIREILESFNVPFADFLVVYAGYLYDHKNFSSLSELQEYKKANGNIEFDPDDYIENIRDTEENTELNRYIENINYLDSEASERERELVMDIIDYFQFKRHHKSNYLRWLKQEFLNDKSTPE